jgi:hypothetical protein
VIATTVPGLDLPAIRAAYQRLWNLNDPNVANAMHDATKFVLQEIQTGMTVLTRKKKEKKKKEYAMEKKERRRWEMGDR